MIAKGWLKYAARHIHRLGTLREQFENLKPPSVRQALSDPRELVKQLMLELAFGPGIHVEVEGLRPLRLPRVYKPFVYSIKYLNRWPIHCYNGNRP